MRVGVSAWRLFGQPLGVARYVEYLLKHWSGMLEPAESVTLFLHEPLTAELSGLSNAIDSRLVHPRMTNALWENLLLPRAARGIDVLFGPSYTLPLTYRGRSVVSIHSVDEAVPGALPSWHRLTYTQKYRLSALRARRVIANSEWTKEQVHRLYGVPRERIAAIWLGADAAFRPVDDEAAARATRRRYFGDDRPYILFVGGLSKRRNVPRLIEAFGLLRQRYRIPHGLLLVGPNRATLPLEELARTHGVSDAVVHTDGRFAHHRDLVPIYNAAELFVLPSSTEGFSLTLAEAMSCGTPAVTVNQATLGEVAHGYALTIEEPEVEAIADAMYRVLSSETTKQELRRKSLERARSFRWEDTARRTLNVLREVAAE